MDYCARNFYTQQIILDCFFMLYKNHIYIYFTNLSKIIFLFLFFFVSFQLFVALATRERGLQSVVQFCSTFLDTVFNVYEDTFKNHNSPLFYIPRNQCTIRTEFYNLIKIIRCKLSNCNIPLNPSTIFLAETLKADIRWSRSKPSTFYTKGVLTFINLRVCVIRSSWKLTMKNILFPVTLAITVPRLALFISLFGALCLSALGIAFPAIIEICVLWPNRDFGPCMIMFIKNIFLIVFGLLGLVIGTYVSIVEIVRSFEWSSRAIFRQEQSKEGRQFGEEVGKAKEKERQRNEEFGNELVRVSRTKLRLRYKFYSLMSGAF